MDHHTNIMTPKEITFERTKQDLAVKFMKRMLIKLIGSNRTVVIHIVHAHSDCGGNTIKDMVAFCLKIEPNLIEQREPFSSIVGLSHKINKLSNKLVPFKMAHK